MSNLKLRQLTAPLLGALIISAALFLSNKLPMKSEPGTPGLSEKKQSESAQGAPFPGLNLLYEEGIVFDNSGRFIYRFPGMYPTFSRTGEVLLLSGEELIKIDK